MTTLDVSSTPGIPLSRLIAVEVRKMGDTRAGKWLLITIVVITTLAVGLVLFFVDEQDKVFDTFLGITATPQGFLLPVLGVLLVTSEWGQRAALTTFTLVPRRERILVAKVVAAVLYGLAAITLAIVVAAAATVLAGADDMWGAYGFGDVGKFALLQTLGILQGLAFGMVFLNSAAAIVTFFVVPIAFNIVTTLIEALRDVQPWIDLAASQTPLFGSDSLSGKEWAQLATATVIWVVVPMVAGAQRMMTSEVK